MNAVTLHNVFKSYGSLPVLENLSLPFPSGSLCCLMSPSGTGKTTLFRLLMGLEQPDKGTISFEMPGRSPRFSAVFQEDRLCEGFSPVENVKLAAGRTLSAEDIRRELALLLPEEALSRPVFTLSGGMKRRTAICRAMAAESDIVIMDEPFTGLDEATKRQAVEYIKSRQHGRLLLISTHQEENVKLLGGVRVDLPNINNQKSNTL